MNSQINLSHRWSNVFINALLTLTIGAVLIFVPEAIYVTIITVIGALLIASGIGFFIFLKKATTLSTKARIIWFSQALINIIVGLFLVFQSELVYDFVIYFIAIWLIISGGIQIFFAPSQKNIVKNTSVILINGVVAIGLGVTILIWPEFPIKFIGYITVLVGFILLYYSFIFFKHRNETITFDYHQDDEIE